MISWPVTLAILLLAFGSLVAAGLPLMLTILGLVAAAGSLYLGTQLLDISIWAMNFALMFALALGIDYALFVVYALPRRPVRLQNGAGGATAVAMDTAGKAVLFSGVTVLISLSAVMLVPSPAFRSMSLGIMLSVLFVLAATLTLLPAVLAKLGPRVDKLALQVGALGRAPLAALRGLGRAPLARPLPYAALALVVLIALTIPVFAPEDRHALDQGRPARGRFPAGLRPGAGGVRPRRHGPAPARQPRAATLPRSPPLAAADPGDRAGPRATAGRGGGALIQAVPTRGPLRPGGRRHGRAAARRAARPTSLVGGPVAENYDLEEALAGKTPLVIGVVLALGFLLLLVALQAPLIAAVGVLTNLLATGAAFGVAKLVFQDGNLQGLLGFDSQGFLDAWGPVFFFAMIFAISMDYTVFLLSSAKEHWDRTGDPKDAMVSGLAHSGRVIFAAAGVMVAVFFTFALSGPLPPKEMGIILGVAVLLDAILVRLLLVPVMLRLLGRWAWYAPPALRMVLPDVRFGHS